MTKSDKFWEKAFEKYNILDCINNDGQFNITAEKIKNLQEEPRLVTKFDNMSQLPQIFVDNKLTILPITRGSYVVAPLDVYVKFPEDIYSSDIKNMEFPENIQSLEPNNITSEATAINCAYISGILEDFVDDNELKPTISGRMSANEFSFNITDHKKKEKISLNIKGSQLEIDGGYEGINSFTIIEAKNNIADDFIVRQLYYPLRLWHNKVSKPIKTIFLVYTNNIFYLYEYKFKDINDYNSLNLIKYQRYSLEKLDITVSDIQNLIDKTKIIQEPTNIPFPQADSFERVINLCELLLNEGLSKQDITSNYGFDSRQTDYYVSAAKYLGLAEENEEIIMLSEQGKKILSLDVRKKQLKF
ncbi:MAG: transcriptional regulator, partial [Alphaproteobacteria bacterium]|nr:transcriptional regulator [Alphaproteobacteria bacterium]